MKNIFVESIYLLKVLVIMKVLNVIWMEFVFLILFICIELLVFDIFLCVVEELYVRCLKWKLMICFVDIWKKRVFFVFFFLNIVVLIVKFIYNCVRIWIIFKSFFEVMLLCFLFEECECYFFIGYLYWFILLL